MARYCRGAGRTAIAVEQGHQLIGLVPLRRLITFPVDPGTVAQS